MGISINLVKPELTDFPPNTDLGSKSCPAGAGQATYIIGQPAANKTIENGKGGVKVTCQVRGDGTFSAAAAGFDGYTQQRISMNISGRITDRASQTAAGEGVMQFYTPDTNALHTNTQKFPGCSFGPVTTLKKGAILTDIMCPILITDDNPSDGCKVKGTIAFEYCTTGEEEE